MELQFLANEALRWVVRSYKDAQLFTAELHESQGANMHRVVQLERARTMDENMDHIRVAGQVLARDLIERGVYEFRRQHPPNSALEYAAMFDSVTGISIRLVRWRDNETASERLTLDAEGFTLLNQSVRPVAFIGPTFAGVMRSDPQKEIEIVQVLTRKIELPE